MKQIDVEELKKMQLEILAKVNLFCKENNISYWLDSGTLLGAIRHNGYIPWDDDIDIGMLREDFNKFISNFNKENVRYQVICNELQQDCFYPYAKVLDTKTALYEPDENGTKLSVNIDLFVYDVTPDEKSAGRQYDRRDRLKNLNVVQYKLFRSKEWYKKIPKTLLYYVLKIYPKGYFASQIVKNSKQYEGTNAKYVGNFTSESRVLCDKKVFDSFIMKEFEGKEYPVPVGYDAWLTAFYGDYMKLPPVEKRISHHAFKAYIDEQV